MKEMRPEHRELFDKLTGLQKRVCTGVLAGLSHREAYYQGGGKAKSDDSADATVAKMLGNARVKAFMDAVHEGMASDAIMTKEEALQRLSTMARGDVSKMAEFKTVELETPDGPVEQTVWHFTDSALQDPGQMSNITELSTGKDGLKFKIHDSKTAIKMLSDMQGWAAPKKIEQTGADGGPIEIEETSPRNQMRKILLALELLKREENP